MFRRLSYMTRRMFGAIGQTFRDFINVLKLPFRNGFRPSAWFRRVKSDVGGSIAQVGHTLSPRSLTHIIARDSKSIVASGHLVAQQTKLTVGSVFQVIIRSPIHLFWFLVGVPQRTWFYLRSRTWMQLGVGTLVLAVGLGAILIPGYTIVKDRRRGILRKEQERQLEENFVSGRIEGVKHNLKVIQGIAPDDEQVLQRLASIESGVSQEGDSKMAGLLMRTHYAAGNWPGAAREARKYLHYYDRDWEALLIVASEAISRGDRGAAAVAIQRLGSPRDLPPWACLIADGIFRGLNDKERQNALVEYVAEEYVPRIRAANLAIYDPGYRVQLAELYNLALTQLEQRPTLKGHWVPVQEVCHSIATDEATKPGVLIRLGRLQEQQLEVYLKQMVHLKLITVDQYKQFALEIEDRLKKVWERLAASEPKNPFAYMGLAMQLARAGELEKASDKLDEGMKICGEIPELIEKKADIMRRFDPAGGLAFVERTLASRSDSLPMCRVLAQAAIASNRPDIALEAVKKAHTIHPDLPWVCQLEAQALIQAGRASEAAAAMRRFLPQLATDPVGILMYMQALVASGSADTAEQYLFELLAKNPRSNVALAGADALARLGQLQSAARVFRAVIQEQRNNVVAQVMLADCLRQLAEQAPGPGWDRELVSEAIKTYRAARDHSPKNLQLVNNIVWLELFALNQPQQAYETSLLLREATDLPPAMLETVAAVQLTQGQYDAARIALESAIQQRGPRAINLALLAHAFHGLGRTTDALVCLRKALTSQKSPREAEIIAGIRRTIERTGG